MAATQRGENKMNRFSAKAGAVIVSVLLINPIAAQAADKRDVEAGPIWSQSDAERKCPQIAAGENGKWTGQWTTTVWGQMSVCEIAFETSGNQGSSAISANAHYFLSTDFRGVNMRLDVHNGGQHNNMTHLAPAGDFSGQFWKFTPAGDGFHKITSMFRGDTMCLDTFNGGDYNNMPHLTQCANYSGQLWKLEPSGGGKYRLKTNFRGDGMCLDIFNGGQHNNMPHLAQCADYSGQLWSLSSSGQ